MILYKSCDTYIQAYKEITNICIVGPPVSISKVGRAGQWIENDFSVANFTFENFVNFQYCGWLAGPQYTRAGCMDIVRIRFRLRDPHLALAKITCNRLQRKEICSRFFSSQYSILKFVQQKSHLFRILLLFFLTTTLVIKKWKKLFDLKRILYCDVWT